MEFWTDFFASFELSRSTLRLMASSVVLIAIVSVLRLLLGRFIRKSVNSSELRQRWLVQSRNALLLILLLGLMMIWATELRTFALSVVAIAVAFVVATKELILCLTGSVVKSAGSAFNIGDRIQVKDFRGDVVDQNLLTTTLLEVGPGKLSHQRTGRMTVIPNSLFVSEAVINESYTHDWVLHVFTVPFKREENWKLAKQAILDTANQYCAPYLEDVRRYMKKKSEQRGLESPSVDPRVTLQVATAGEIHLVVRIPVKAGKRSFIEQSILTDVFVNYSFAPTPVKLAEASTDEVDGDVHQ